jgi:hypothetical protein
MMSADNRLNQLKRQISRESLGPVDVATNHAMSFLSSVIASTMAWLRTSAYERPLITLLLSFQAGYVLARLGGRHARH